MQYSTAIPVVIICTVNTADEHDFDLILDCNLKRNEEDGQKNAHLPAMNK